jgi:hypothetical protein
VLVTPVLAPKMPPGHALLLAPGVALGVPGLVPLLLSGATAALLILLVSEVGSPATAMLTLIIWLTAAGQMRWRASYFSELTTGMVWLLACWSLLRWRTSRQTWWLLLLAASIGWGAITRPLTMLALAVPIGVVVVIDVVRDRRWLQLSVAFIVGSACLLVLPLQNREVLGSWRASPLTVYTRQYMPFDVIGFGLDSTPPTLGLPAGLQPAQAGFIALHRAHRIGTLPKILLNRLGMIGNASFGGWRRVWLPMALIGLFVITGPGWFAVGSAILLYLAYLLYAHEPYWTVYYLEVSPVPAYLTAAGLVWLLRQTTGMRGPLRLPVASTVAIAVMIVAAQDVNNARRFRRAAQLSGRQFVAAVDVAHRGPALVFLRYSGARDPNANLLRNVADPATAPIITAYDRGGAENHRVAAAFPGRRVIYWDASTGHIVAASTE